MQIKVKKRNLYKGILLLQTKNELTIRIIWPLTP